MDGWYQSSRPRYSPAVRGIPVRRSPPKPSMSSSPKIISIPVHFLGSETTSALKIQKVLRGFLVRKGINRILAIKREVEEIEGRLSEKQTTELLGKDAKERLRINETLMALLFKLDSIRGVYAEIRECRKAVIRKVVALQEKLDCLAAVSEKKENEFEDVIVECDNCNLGSGVALLELDSNNSQPSESGNEDKLDSTGACEIIPAMADQRVDTEVVCDEKEINEVPSAIQTSENDERRRSDEIMERMMTENEKLMKVVRQLCQRNEMQTQLLTSLMHRVECLEKALVCNKVRKKKKTNHYV